MFRDCPFNVGVSHQNASSKIFIGLDDYVVVVYAEVGS
jgi:hypothetical protein